MRRSLLTLFMATMLACTAGTGGTTLAPTPTTPPPPSTAATVGDTTTVPSTVTETTTSTTQLATIVPEDLVLESFPVPAGSGPHDVAPALDGGVWYTAQDTGELGWLDPSTGETRHTALGEGSAPHGVIVDAAGTAWVTDGGLNAIVAVDPVSLEVTVYPLPSDRPDASLNTASFDGDGMVWFTGQNGIYGCVDPDTGEVIVFDAPQGPGPYGITTTPDGVVFYASLAGSHIARIESDRSATVIEPPTADQGARRVWSDSLGAIWVSEWNAGNLSRYSPETDTWDTWHLPGHSPETYAVFVDDSDIVWASDFGSNSIVRFDPTTEEFHTYALPHDPGNVRQILGRPGEVWLPESAADNLIVIRTSA
ncbi:MAG: virginiamycin B lyase family protein [Acidimicrobiia bacterium]